MHVLSVALIMEVRSQIFPQAIPVQRHIGQQIGSRAAHRLSVVVHVDGLAELVLGGMLAYAE